MKKFIITEEVVKGLLNYLQERPFKEVAQGIQTLINLPEHKEKEEPKEVKK